MVKLNANYSVVPTSDHRADSLIILESRGGTKTGRTARNPDYAKQLSRILRLLKAESCVITRVEVLSTRSLRNNVPRILKLNYPINLKQVASAEKLRAEIQAAQRTIAQRPGASGGNTTKRIGIWIKAGPQIPSIGLKSLLTDR